MRANFANFHQLALRTGVEATHALKHACQVEQVHEVSPRVWREEQQNSKASHLLRRLGMLLVSEPSLVHARRPRRRGGAILGATSIVRIAVDRFPSL